jgi:hypothetical protein
MEQRALPGQEWIREGIEDLSRGIESVSSLLVSIGAPRLRKLGLAIPDDVFASPEHRLYRLLSQSNTNAAHGRYNALIRRLVSYERAAECVN